MVVSEKALLFQADNIPTVNSTATYLMDSDDPSVLYDLTVCTWLHVLYFREKTYVYSYATSDKDNNELNLGMSE